ncbi:spore germination protein GerPE [Metabacillus arenae]|uniref:Spore germination protein GerPE n=1 Tax=Metabacillus arenae TaxID=2771434 RepID=A0A926NGF0_9BACI|nr:spore germination protein GerPE [Metabacillus arenae]MBD1380620.1 spore germination protein GerPE [Metabacillus arenae]
MLNRLSAVDQISVNSVGLSSIFQIGDSVRITPSLKVLAVQRESNLFFAREGNFKNDQAFFQELPIPLITENIQTGFFHDKPVIKVHSIKVMAVSSSSVFHVGSTDRIQTESRIRHIRQLLPDKNRK